MKYWLMKSEPDVFSIDHLKAKGISGWDGVRNYQARNFMRDEMKLGDLAFFYHSNAQPPGIIGIMEVAQESAPDPGQFDKKSEYYDAKATREKPIWMMVEVKYREKFRALIPLEQLRADKALQHMMLLKRNRLSITPVTPKEWQHILQLAKNGK